MAVRLATMHRSKLHYNAPRRHTFVLPCLLDLIDAMQEHWKRLQLEFVESTKP